MSALWAATAGLGDEGLQAHEMVWPGYQKSLGWKADEGHLSENSNPMYRQCIISLGDDNR